MSLIYVNKSTRIETNIPNDDKSNSDEYLTLNITINPASATITPKYERRQEAERMKYGTK